MVNFKKAQWYEEEQIGIPWVNMYEEQNKNPQPQQQTQIPTVTEPVAPATTPITNNVAQAATNATIPTFKELYWTPKTSDTNLNNAYNKATAWFWNDDLWNQAKTDMWKMYSEAQDKINDTYDTYSIHRGELEKNKSYYKNFDNVNSTFDNVLKDIRETQKNTWTITDIDYQTIASKYWVTPEDIKNPLNLFKKLEYTEEWERKFWFDKWRQTIDNLTKNYNRNKEDLQFSLEWARQNLDNQIEDTKLQLQRNLAWGEAQWAWNNSFRSSWYQMWLDNIKKDWERVINRLEQAKERLKTANETNLKRLTEDYNEALKEAKTTLDEQMKEMKFDYWLKLNTATKKYWVDSKDLTKALNWILQDLWAWTMDIFTKYHQNVNLINQNAEKNLDLYDHYQKIIDNRENKRYNELLANNWIVLNNTSLKQIVSEVQSWTISPEKAINLKNIMLSSIQATLSKTWQINTEDLNTIEAMLENWNTPEQIIAKFSSLDRFKKREKPVEVNPGNSLVDPLTWKVIYQAPYAPNKYTSSDSSSSAYVWNNITLPSNWIDLSINTELVNKHPNEASFKNNNPTWLTWWVSKWLIEDWQKAWINFSKWTPRPSNEGWNYIKFATLQDWMEAYKIALTRSNFSVFDRLKQWVWHNDSSDDTYANRVLASAWLLHLKDTPISSISDSDLNKLVASQLKAESWGLYKYMESQWWISNNWVNIWNIWNNWENWGYDNNNIPLYQKFNSWKFTKADWSKIWENEEIFKQKAYAYSQNQKNIQNEIQWSELYKIYKNLQDIKKKPAWAFLWENYESDFWNKLNYVKNNLTFDKLTKLKEWWATFGAMSDSEWKKIEWAGSMLNLNFWTKDKDWERYVADTMTEIEKAFDKLWFDYKSKSWASQQQVIPWGRVWNQQSTQWVWRI